MSCDAYWDELELQFETLSQVDPHSGATWDDFPHYPAPLLKRSGSTTTRRFRTAVLENEFLRVDVLPALGGRILGIYDKAAKAAIIPIPSQVELRSNGSILDFEWGVWWSVGFDRSPYGLDEVDCQVLPPEDDYSPASVVLFGMCPGTRTSWHAAVSLGPEASAIGLTLAAFNRDLSTRPASTNIRAYLGRDSEAFGKHACISNEARGVSLCFLSDPGELALVETELDTLVLRRFGPGEKLSPRQTDKMELRLLPIAGMTSPNCASEDCAIAIRDGQIQVFSGTSRKTKLVIQTRSQTMEMPLDLSARSVVEVSTKDVGTVDRAALISEGRVLVDSAQTMRFGRAPAEASSFDGHSLLETMNLTSIRGASRDLRLKHTSLALQASLYAGEGDYAQAAEALDSALAFNAEDPLTWWLKAAVIRVAGRAEDDMPEMPNAHFLAPLEPLLRAEAFLSQPPQDKEPSPLVKPLRPEAMLEVANVLVESGLHSEAARWLDECLRHHDLPMFRYLLAWMLLTRSKMRAEAAMHVSAAALQEFAPPFPSRHTDFRVIKELAAEFPHDSRLQGWLQIAEVFSRPKS